MNSARTSLPNPVANAGMRFASLLVALATSLSALAAPVRGEPNAVLRWNELAVGTSAEAGTDPVSESRMFAMLQIAVCDAVNTVEPRMRRYVTRVPEMPGASREAAVAQASHDVMVALLPARAEVFDRALAAALAGVAEGDAKTHGIEAGRAAAKAVLAARRGDDAAVQFAKGPAGTKPGQYRPTPPDLTPALMPQWGGLKPFALQSGDQFRPAPPPEVSGPRARRDLEEIAKYGASEGAARSPEQSEIARFWYEFATRGWNRVARTVAEERGLDLGESARLLALVNVAMGDGFIAAMDAKYHYQYWRPETAVREAGRPDWLSALPTPPVPDYPSGHAVLGAAAATVLARVLGGDFASFTVTSGVPYAGITRHFWSFSEAARENAASRVLAGIHFSSAVEVGYRMGEGIGAWTVDHAPESTGGASAILRHDD